MDRPVAQSLAWFIHDVLRLLPLLNQVTVKRRRRAGRRVRRRRSAFRDPVMCLDFLAMAWLGATRLSQVARQLSARADLARVFGLPRFADHTTAHNVLNAFRASHLAQLDRVNDELLRRHGPLRHDRPAALDLDAAPRPVRRRGGGRSRTYLWVVAFAGGLAVAQRLDENVTDPSGPLLELLGDARARWPGRPRLVRLTHCCVSERLLRALLRQRLHFAASTSWAWTLSRLTRPPEAVPWLNLGPDERVRDLGPWTLGPARRPNVRGVLVERASLVPGAPPHRAAIVTSLLDGDPAALAALASAATTMRSFFGHPSWPLRDGKPPSSRSRGMAAYLRLATLAMNVLELFARELGPPWTRPRLHRALRVIRWPSDLRPPRPPA